MRIGVVDDERPARGELMYLIREAEPDTEIFEADSPEAILEILKTEALDGCFVDINLGERNGTTLAAMMKRIQPDINIVFATAYPDHALRAFEIGALDYILKPYDPDRISAALTRIRSRITPEDSQTASTPTSEAKSSLSAPDMPSQTPASDSASGEASPLDARKLHRILVSGGDSMRVLEVKDIIYIETLNRACHIHTLKECFVENQSLSYYETRLAGENFFRIHKSYLVNLRYLKELVPTYNNGYGCRLRGFESLLLPVGRTQMKLLRDKLE